METHKHMNKWTQTHETGDELKLHERTGSEAAHLQGVHEVLHQEEATHLLQGSVDVGQAGVHVLAESFRRDADVFLDQRSVEKINEGGK